MMYTVISLWFAVKSNIFRNLGQGPFPKLLDKNLFAYLVLHVVLCCECLPGFFFKIIFLKISYRNTIRVSNNLVPDQAQYLVRPDLHPNFF